MTARCTPLGVPAPGSGDVIRAWVAPLSWWGTRLRAVVEGRGNATGAAHQLVTLHEIGGDHEKYLHVACAAFRVQGEWFTPSDEFFAALRAAIDAIASSTG